MVPLFRPDETSIFHRHRCGWDRPSSLIGLIIFEGPTTGDGASYSL